MSTVNDKEYLKEQYRESRNLDARIDLHECFTVGQHNWYRWSFEHLAFPPQARILELGCGTGMLWLRNLDRLASIWSVHLSDFSQGMVDKARAALRHTQHVFHYQAIDAQAIPYADQIFDAVMANHMLYHVPDRPRALREIRRVLKPDGVFNATANSLHHFQEVYALIQEINPQASIELSQAAFGLENGVAQIAEIFNTVSSEVFDSALAITTSAPLLAYLQSSRHAAWIHGQESIFQERVDREIHQYGAMHVNTSGGLITARN
jgi:ubiquinone/menaquinone biosynthesis C-methylase UbiE